MTAPLSESDQEFVQKLRDAARHDELWQEFFSWARGNYRRAISSLESRNSTEDLWRLQGECKVWRRLIQSADEMAAGIIERRGGK